MPPEAITVKPGALSRTMRMESAVGMPQSRKARATRARQGSLWQACGLTRLWRTGFVEPVTAPPLPAHLLAHQLLRDLSAPTAQQDRMKSCNADAATKSLAGEARQRFMSDCLSGKTAAAAPAQPQMTAQQERMKSCNAEAATKNLSGEPRQRFMSSCLSGPSKVRRRDER